MSSVRVTCGVSQASDDHHERHKGSSSDHDYSSQPCTRGFAADARRDEARSMVGSSLENASRAASLMLLRQYTESISHQSQQVQNSARLLMTRTETAADASDHRADSLNQDLPAELLPWTAKLDEAVAQIRSIMEELQKLTTCPGKDLHDDPTLFEDTASSGKDGRDSAAPVDDQ